jgi:hypothetical protein
MAPMCLHNPRPVPFHCPAFIWPRSKTEDVQSDSGSNKRPLAKFVSFVQEPKSVQIGGFLVIAALVNFAPPLAQTKAGIMQSFNEISNNQLPKYISELFGTVGVASAILTALESCDGKFMQKKNRGIRLIGLAAFSATGWHVGKALAPALFNPPKTLLQAVQPPISGLARDLQAVLKRFRKV